MMNHHWLLIPLSDKELCEELKTLSALEGLLGLLSWDERKYYYYYYYYYQLPQLRFLS